MNLYTSVDVIGTLLEFKPCSQVYFVRKTPVNWTALQSVFRGPMCKGCCDAVNHVALREA